MSRIDLDRYVEENSKLLTDQKIHGRPEREAQYMALFLSNPLYLAIGPRLAWAGNHAKNEAIEAYPDRPTTPVFDSTGKVVSNTARNDVDGHRDATRHILATIQAMKATNVPGVNNPELGFQFMQARETYKGNNPIAAAMDMHNNAVGAEIYRRNPNATDEQFIALAKNAVKSGQAVVVGRDGGLAWSDQVRPYEHGSSEHNARRNRRADGDDGTAVAALPPHAERDPLVQQIRGAIDARTAKGEALSTTPSDIAALATAAHRERFDQVGDVVRGKDGQLFAVDHPQADNPAARFVRADNAVATLPPSAAWQKLGEALAQPQAQAVANAEVDPLQRGPRMA
jgi:hypothetical protein